MNRTLATITVISLTFLIAGLASAQTTPQTITVQGYVTQSGTPVNGATPMTFTLFDSAVGGNNLGQITDPAVQVSDGVYEVELSFDESLFSGSSRYIEITVNGEVMTPRMHLVSTPYAYHAEKLDGSEAADFVQKSGDTMSGPLTVNGLIHSTTAGIRFPDGTTQLTAQVEGPPGPAVTLDGAYDEGGPGAGRTINADAGAVEIAGGGGLHVTGGGSIGVGTTNPVHALQIQNEGGDAAVATSLSDIVVASTDAWVELISSSSGSNGSNLMFKEVNADGTLQNNWALYRKTTSSGSDFVMSFGDSADPDGNPTFMTLTSGGMLKVNVLQILGGADLVEGFHTSGNEALAPGTVVVIDPDNPGALMASAEAYDLKVAGVVSGAGGVEPGIHLGQDSLMDGDTQVAMTGRVYVRCSTENGPIRPGTLLTTGSLPGHAMAATDPSRSNGSVIGKAMSSLDDETGLVLVLVNLQ